MRGLFDEDERPEPAPQPRRDTELTLGFGTLLGLFFGLVLLCGLCFGLGYEVGRGSSSPPVILQPNTAAKAPATSTPKPSATESQPAAASSGEAASGGGAASMVQQGFGAPAATQPQQPVPALPSPPAYTPVPQQQRVQPALPTGQLTVQIAAVSNPEDGDVLVNALRKHGYAVTARRENDNLIHVRIGPFSTRDEANRWRQKLLNDGYNAIVEQ